MKKYTFICPYCGEEFTASRCDAKYCCDAHSRAFRQRGRKPKERTCKLCGTLFPLLTSADANRQYCSRQCSKKAETKSVRTWNEEHPGRMKQYNANRLKKNPDAWKEKWNKGREDAIALLGGSCVVCGATNKWWLHIDYIPTTRGMKYRHSRSIKFIRDHLQDFRLLCANHHYELTLTGKIEGTEITQ